MSKRYPGGIIRKTPQTPSQTSARGVWDMASVTQAVKENNWPIAGVPDPLSRSLRFRSSASAQLTRTVSGVNTTQLTFSCWFKSSVNSTDNVLYSTANNSSNYLYIGLNSSNVLDIQIGATANRRVTTQVFRDPSAWYHLVVTFDSTQSTASDRIKVYVNGSQVTAFSTSTTGMSQNANLPSISSTLTNYIGGYNGSAGFYFDGYMTEIYMVYGQALTPSSFGTTDDQTGVWEPIAYTGTYGTNGFYLPFSNTASTATLGNDFSGNSNNWTTNNISLTSGSTYDSMVDVPTQWIPYNTAGDTGALWRGNYCTLNPIKNTLAAYGTISDGNLKVNGTSGSINCLATGTMVFAGKMYCEMTIETRGSDTTTVGVGVVPITNNQFSTALNMTTGIYYIVSGQKQVSGTNSAYGSSYTSGDVIGIAVDTSAETVTFYKNNVSQGSISGTGVIAAGVMPYIGFQDSGSPSIICNFGQRPFSYTPPSGFKTLCTTNLPTPTIGATASTQANKYFDINLWSGDNTTPRTITNGNFTSDFVWVKQRNGTGVHLLWDAVRAGGLNLQSQSTGAETAYTSLTAGGISGSATNGFTVAQGSVDSNYVNGTGGNYVGWQWKANGSGSTNTAGSITSTVSANTSAGFSVVTYTTPSSGVYTVGHGLGVAPKLIINKARGTTGGWLTWHISLTGGASNINTYLFLNTTDAQATSGSQIWSAPTSTTFGCNSGLSVSANTTYVAYCFSEIAGYSAFGSYTGNGSSDGTFVFTGFRPRYIMIKPTNVSGEYWQIIDTSRNPYNGTDANMLSANLSNAEASIASQTTDILSNGFKLRGTSGNTNGSGTNYIYMAFAEFPFKFSLAR